VLGLTFTIQSAEYGPRVCEKRISQFLESYINEFDEATFDEYLKGLIAKKQSGFRDAKEEYQALKAQFKSFTTIP
jgi:hypothetical protein